MNLKNEPKGAGKSFVVACRAPQESALNVMATRDSAISDFQSGFSHSPTWAPKHDASCLSSGRSPKKSARRFGGRFGGEVFWISSGGGGLGAGDWGPPGDMIWSDLFF